MANTSVSVVGLSTNSFTVTFQGVSGNQNQPALILSVNNLTPAPVTMSNVETVQRASTGPSRFTT